MGTIVAYSSDTDAHSSDILQLRWAPLFPIAQTQMPVAQTHITVVMGAIVAPNLDSWSYMHIML